MGRVKRYKRIKAIDPFSKTGGKVDFDLGKSYDLGPSKKDIEAIPRSIQMMLDKKAALAGEKPALRPDKPKNTSFFSHVKMLPGESMSAFHRRLNNERTKALASIRQEAKESKHISSKRKEYLDKKKEKKKLRGTGELEAGYAADAPDPLNEKGGLKNKRKRAQREQEGGGDLDDSDGEHAPSAKREKTMEFPSDRVTFGERAMEPPKLTVKPRKSQVSHHRHDSKLISANQSVIRRTSCLLSPAVVITNWPFCAPQSRRSASITYQNASQIAFISSHSRFRSQIAETEGPGGH